MIFILKNIENDKKDYFMKKRYLSASENYATVENPVSAPLFRKTFDYSYKTARLEICVVGLYRLFVNKKEITKGLLSPYFSNPDQTVFYDEYEIKDLLKEKDNEITVLLGNGFVNSIDGNVWQYENAVYRSAPKFYLGIFDGEKEVITTDETFEVYSSPILFDNYRLGEWYDARLEKDVYKNPQKPILADEPKGEYVKNTSTPILIEREIKPVKITKSGEGYIYDFGEISSGVCKLTINANEGQVIEYQHAEIVNENQLYLDNIIFVGRTNAKYFQKEIYVCKNGKQTYVPSFVYHGFRYVYITGITETQATNDLLTFVVFHNYLEKSGTFECDNIYVNKLQQMAINSDVSNIHHFPTDCPQREKNGWTGDINLSVEQFSYNFEIYPILKQYLHILRNSQLSSGAIPCICPTASWGYDWGSGMGWDTIIAILPYELYRFSGNQEVLYENAQTLKNYIKYLDTKFNEKGLLTFGLGDWCEAGSLDVAVATSPIEVSDSLLCVDFYNKSIEIFKEIGDTEEVNNITLKRDNLINNFRKEYVKNGQITVDSQTAEAFALSFGIYDENEEKTAYAHLKRVIEEDGGKMRVGALGGRYLFDVLASHGDVDLALDMMLNEDFPSFLYWINLGSSTLHEAFYEYKEDYDGIKRKDDYDYIVSFNHHFWGSISAFFYKNLAGINVVNYNTVTVSPKFPKNINFVKSTYNKNGNKLEVLWERKQGKITLKIKNSGFNCTFNGKKIENEYFEETI